MTVAVTHSMETVAPMKYPKSILYIVGIAFCEKYSYYGILCLLPLYLRNALNYAEEDAMMIIHTFSCLYHILPVFGGVLADSYIGMYQTILRSSLVATAGNAILALSATLWFFSPRMLAILGLLLTALGAGLMKPCMSSFGGQQFDPSQQAKQLVTFFSIYYFTVNIGALLTSIMVPILRQDVKCLGHETCYPLAFAVPGILLVLALVFFVCRKPLYKMHKPTSNILADVLKCVFYALRKKLSSEKRAKKPSHWLEYGEEKFGPHLVREVREVLKVLVMFLPVPLYCALNNQQFSSWIFQMSKMDGVVGGWFTIKPEQIGSMNPLLCVLLVPVFEVVLYPVLAKIGIKRPLQLIVIGAFLNGAAFVMSAYVEYTLEPSDARLPAPGLGQLRIFNGLPCQLELDPPINERCVIPPLGALQWTDIPVNGTRPMEEQINLSQGLSCNNITVVKNWTEEISLFEEKSTSYIVSPRGGIAHLFKVPGFDDVRKSESNAPRVRVIHNLDGPLIFKNQNGEEHTFQLHASDLVTSVREVGSGSYQVIYAKEIVFSNLQINSGGVYTLVLQHVNSNTIGNLHVITPPSPLHILWIMPQTIVITVAELFFELTFMSFTFTQVPETMKSVTLSVFILSKSLGDILVVFMEEMRFFHRQTYQYLFYAGLMLLDVILLIFLSIWYKYKDTVSVGNMEISSEYGLDKRAINEKKEPLKNNESAELKGEQI